MDHKIISNKKSSFSFLPKNLKKLAAIPARLKQKNEFIKSISISKQDFDNRHPGLVSVYHLANKNILANIAEHGLHPLKTGLYEKIKGLEHIGTGRLMKNKTSKERQKCSIVESINHYSFADSHNTIPDIYTYCDLENTSLTKSCSNVYLVTEKIFQAYQNIHSMKTCPQKILAKSIEYILKDPEKIYSEKFDKLNQLIKMPKLYKFFSLPEVQSALKSKGSAAAIQSANEKIHAIENIPYSEMTKEQKLLIILTNRQLLNNIFPAMLPKENFSVIENIETIKKINSVFCVPFMAWTTRLGFLTLSGNYINDPHYIIEVKVDPKQAYVGNPLLRNNEEAGAAQFYWQSLLPLDIYLKLSPNKRIKHFNSRADSGELQEVLVQDIVPPKNIRIVGRL